MTRGPLIERVRQYMGPLISRRGFAVRSFGPSVMGEEAVHLDSDEFWVLIRRDRGGHEWIEVGSKIRPKPRAPLRNYLLSRVIAYLDGSDPNIRCDLESEASWLIDREEEILHSALINSEDLRLWNENIDWARQVVQESLRNHLGLYDWNKDDAGESPPPSRD